MKKRKAQITVFIIVGVIIIASVSGAVYIGKAKIESDLSINDNMHFAWMVSLNSNICEYNKFTIMTKWITTDVGVKCILFINNLLSNKEPRDILRQAWMICNDFHRLTKKTVKEDGELEKYREKFLLHKKLIENLQERAAEIRRGVNVFQNSVKNLENELLEILKEINYNPDK